MSSNDISVEQAILRYGRFSVALKYAKSTHFEFTGVTPTQSTIYITYTRHDEREELLGETTVARLASLGGSCYITITKPGGAIEYQGEITHKDAESLISNKGLKIVS